VIFIVLYLLSYPLVLYDNYFSMRLAAERSRIANAPSFFIIVRLITYGSIIGLWFKYGWRTAIATLVVSWFFNKSTFKFFFKKYIHQKAQQLIKSDWFETELPNEERLLKAYEYAETLAYRNAAGEE